MVDRGESGHGDGENLAAFLPDYQPECFLIYAKFSIRDTFMLFQYIDHIIFVFEHIFHFVLLIF